MFTIAILILAIALLAGLALFVFKNAAKIVALILVVFMGYIGWHIYLKDKGISPNQATESVSKKGEKLFNDALDTMIGSVSSASEKAMDTAKEKVTEATEKAMDSTKQKAKEVTAKAKEKAKKKVNEALE